MQEGEDAHIPVKLYPGATLAQRDPGREFLALRDGAADLAVGSALAWSAQLPALGVYALPWLASEPKELTALCDDASVRRSLIGLADEQGVILLAFAPLGWRDVATLRGPLRLPGDLRDLRLRTALYPVLLDLFTALGARVQTLGAADAQTALTTGGLDGDEGPATSLAAARIGALGAKHLLHWGGVADVMVFAVRRPVWDRLSQAKRDRLVAAATQAARESDALAREEAALLALRRQGMTVQRLSEAQRGLFRQAVAAMSEKWAGIIGAEVVGAARQAVATAGSTR